MYWQGNSGAGGLIGSFDEGFGAGYSYLVGAGQSYYSDYPIIQNGNGGGTSIPTINNPGSNPPTNNPTGSDNGEGRSGSTNRPNTNSDSPSNSRRRQIESVLTKDPSLTPFFTYPVPYPISSAPTISSNYLVLGIVLVAGLAIYYFWRSRK